MTDSEFITMARSVVDRCPEAVIDAIETQNGTAIQQLLKQCHSDHQRAEILKVLVITCLNLGAIAFATGSHRDITVKSRDH